MQMLESIQQVHDRGFIHRDIKPSNFVLGNDNRIVLSDFGLAKVHINKVNGRIYPPRKRVYFRGTISFASLNSHLGNELSRRDDLWSWYFILLDYYGESLKWREDNQYTMSEVAKIKKIALSYPHKCLWSPKTNDLPQIREIFKLISDLKYDEKPPYNYINQQLLLILAYAECKTYEDVFGKF